MQKPPTRLDAFVASCRMRRMSFVSPCMSLLVRYRHDGRVHLGAQHDESVSPLPFDTLGAALRLHVDNLREHVERAVREPSLPLGSVEVLTPVDAQEVWIACDAGAEAQPVVPGRQVHADAGSNARATGVAAVITAHGEIAGYAVGDDIGGGTVGPGIRPAWELPPQPVFEIDLAVRRDSELVVQGSADTSGMARDFVELAASLTSGRDFPHGAVLLTGTGLAAAEQGFALRPGDQISITVAGIGTLRHVVTAGANGRLATEPAG
jgi:2-dehydro-3-deoxy-D-arabinonate dehydratase